MKRKGLMYMETDVLKKYIATEDITLVDAMQKIEKNSVGILFIVDDGGHLTGSLSDGDIRRRIIRTGSLNGTIKDAVHRDVTALAVEEINRYLDIMREKRIHSIPVTDADGRVIDIRFTKKGAGEPEYHEHTLESIPVIIMAGGMGTRLHPFTKILPKPLIPIGDIPILERIIVRFQNNGAREFYITVNYKKEMIKAYFAEQNLDISLTYVEENVPLGTAGGIRLIDRQFDTPVIVTNCDILVEADYEKLMSFHRLSGNEVTIVSALRNTSIPYGVIHAKENGVITSMEEKPVISHFINTGMYVVNPNCIGMIPKNTFFHMTDLSDLVMKAGMQVGMYPIGENAYLDMGEFEEMKKMEERISEGYTK